MEEFIKHSSGDRKPEHYFKPPGEEYFEELSGEVFSRIRDSKPVQKTRFSFLPRPALAISLAVLIVLAIFMWPGGSTVAPAETVSEEEIMIDIIASDLNINEDAEMLLPVSNSEQEVIDMMSTEEMEDYYEQISNEDI